MNGLCSTYGGVKIHSHNLPFSVLVVFHFTRYQRKKTKKILVCTIQIFKKYAICQPNKVLPFKNIDYFELSSTCCYWSDIEEKRKKTYFTAQTNVQPSYVMQ